MSDFDDLVGALAGIPRLAGARCIGKWELFDPPPPDMPADVAAQRQAAAIALCNTCPALDQCRAWALSLRPSKRPPGVVAGRVITPPQPRKKAS